ncbi:hypothetical protein [Enterobacter cloacae]|uniref:hypothetical protein n=1 Tax=Enterobacter cloacae TaxID=550 RepID=UPI003754C382
MSVKRYEWVACDEHSCHCDVVESAEGDMVGVQGAKDVEIHNICVDAHNVHVGIWNQLQSYINQLTRKPVTVKSKGVQS